MFCFCNFSANSTTMTLMVRWACGTSDTTWRGWKRRNMQWTRMCWKNTSPWRLSQKACLKSTKLFCLWNLKKFPTLKHGTLTLLWWGFSWELFLSWLTLKKSVLIMIFRNEFVLQLGMRISLRYIDGTVFSPRFDNQIEWKMYHLNC